MMMTCFDWYEHLMMNEDDDVDDNEDGDDDGDDNGGEDGDDDGDRCWLVS